jgi:hypothetical protein
MTTVAGTISRYRTGKGQGQLLMNLVQIMMISDKIEIVALLEAVKLINGVTNHHQALDLGLQ